ncbi:MAG TPA: hypothetical protein VEJ41_02135 [Candidatus Acidoferrales bacterium]|nr:hypothetical protein [Candidatus Acidoferrales bacterium]
MADEARFLEERLTKLEEELRLANERVREFEGWRRRAMRVFLLGLASVIGLAVAVSQTIAAKGNLPILKGEPPLTVEAPFIVVDSSGHPLARIFDEHGNGGKLNLYSTSGQDIAELGISTTGSAGVSDVAAPDKKHEAMMVADNELGSWHGVSNGVTGVPIAALGEGAINGSTTEPAIFLNNKKGAAVVLEVEKDTGKLQLTNAAGEIRVEAGTELNDDGAVKVSGPRGQCLPQVGGIACMLTAR